MTSGYYANLIIKWGKLFLKHCDYVANNFIALSG